MRAETVDQLRERAAKAEAAAQELATACWAMLFLVKTGKAMDGGDADAVVHHCEQLVKRHTSPVSRARLTVALEKAAKDQDAEPIAPDFLGIRPWKLGR